MGFPQRGNPGFEFIRETEEAQVWFSALFNEFNQFIKSCDFDSTNTDPGNTPTSTLRGGLVIAEDESTGLCFVYDADANNGRQCVVGVLPQPIDMLDSDGTAEQKNNIAILTSAAFLNDQLLGDFDPAARAQLIRRGSHFDTGLGEAFLSHPKCTQDQTGNRTLVAADSGIEFIATNTVVFTLPTIENGLSYLVRQSSDNPMTITSAEGNNILALNDTAASSLAFSTATEQIGAAALIRAIFIGSTLTWVVDNLSDATITIT